MEDAEHRAVGADANREREDDAGEEKRRTPEAPPGEAEVARQCGHGNLEGSGYTAIPARRASKVNPVVALK